MTAGSTCGGRSGVTVLYYSQAVSVKGLYTTQAEFDKAAASMEGNTAFIAMAGPARALNTIGGQVDVAGVGLRRRCSRG